MILNVVAQLEQLLQSDPFLLKIKRKIKVCFNFNFRLMDFNGG
jgi:hypothetical protein